MRCVRCGRELPDGVKECGFCGMILSEVGTRDVRSNVSPESRFQGPYATREQNGQMQGVYQSQQNGQMQGVYQSPQNGQMQGVYQSPQNGQMQGIYQSPQNSQRQVGYPSPQNGQMQGVYQSPQNSQPQVGYQSPQNGQPQMAQSASHENQLHRKPLYIPNVINIIGMIMAVVSLFLPYAQMSGDSRSIIGVFDFTMTVILIGIAVFLADMICAFANNIVCFIVNFLISVAVGALFIWELVLAFIDMGKLEANVDAGLMFGAWFSAVTAIILVVSVPVWRIVTGRRTREDKS